MAAKRRAVSVPLPGDMVETDQGQLVWRPPFRAVLSFLYLNEPFFFTPPLYSRCT